MRIEDILNTYAIPVQVDGVTFNFKPWTTEEIDAFNRVADFPRSDDETNAEWTARQRDAQLDHLAKHFRAAVTDGNKSKVTTKWMKAKLPRLLIEEIVHYLRHGVRPSWAPEAGRGN